MSKPLGDMVFRGQRVLIDGAFVPAAVHVKGGRITDISGPEDIPAGCRVIDADDAHVLPGVVNSHVHVNEPGRTEWEGFDTATRAAAAGGVTTLVDMPLNAIPPTTTVAGLETKRSAAEGKVWIDVGFWGGVIPDNTQELEPMRERGVAGFKCFLAPSGVEEFPHVTEPNLRPAMEILAASGTPLLVHAELPGPLAAAEEAARVHSPVKYLSYLLSRPPSAEDEAIALVVRLAKEIGTRVHIVHHAAASGLPILSAARDNHVAITAESCPHYLHFRAEDVPDGATMFKCAPPIREGEHREELWNGLAAGTLDMIVSDHSPCKPELKKLDDGDFLAAWGGISSLQLSFAVAWTEAKTRGVPLAKLADWMSAEPAKLAGFSQKGSIARGKDADLIFFAPEEPFRVQRETLHHRHKRTAYEGDSLFGAVRATFLRGQKIYEQGQFTGRPKGALLRRS